MSLIELSPNKLLLNSNFDGYKLSLKEVPIVRRTFTSPVDKILLNSDQYSVLHAKLYGLHNHLIPDPYNENNSVYFIDKDWNVIKIFHGNDNVIELVPVWKIPNDKGRTGGDYNVSMKFVSPNVVVIGDGTGLLHIVETGTRANNDSFSADFADEVLGNGEPFIVVDAALVQRDQDITELHVVLLNIKQDNPNERFFTVVHWVTLAYRDKKWGQIALKQIKCNGNIEYAVLETSCNAVYLISDGECKFILNSDCPVVPDAHKGNEDQKVYDWSQNVEEITVKIALPEKSEKELISVQSQSTHLEVLYNSKVFLMGELYERIHSDMTNWTFSQNMLEINLHKQENGIWPKFLKTNEKDEQVLDLHNVDKVHKKLAHLCSNIEVGIYIIYLVLNDNIEDNLHDLNYSNKYHMFNFFLMSRHFYC